MKVVDRLFTQSGGQVLRTGDPLGRAFQDVHAIRAHYANNPELPGRNLGRTLLGGKNQDYFV
jgi:3-hydroxy-9,10-secoandrosta-1,3,5(10)-triene-9,17-dione monooxygenase